MTGKGTIDVSLRAYGAILWIPLIAERSREKREIQEPRVRGGVRGGAHRFPRFFRFCLMMNAKSAIMTKWLNVFENQRTVAKKWEILDCRRKKRYNKAIAFGKEWFG